MNNNEFDIHNNVLANPHVSNESLLAFQQDRMTLQERELFLNHICSCMYCSEQLAELMTGEVIPAPKDMKKNILSAVKYPEVQFAKKARETSKSIQLFVYTLKIGIATLAALYLLIFTVNNSTTISPVPDFYNEYESLEKSNPVTTAISTGIDTLGTGMDAISNNMLEFSSDIITRR